MGVGRAGMYSYDWVFHPPSGLAYTVAMVSAPRLIVYRGQSLSPVTWMFYLLPNDDGTRLITRWRGSKANGAGETVANAVFGKMDFVMGQRMLTRIKELAESHATEVRNVAVALDVLN